MARDENFYRYFSFFVNLVSLRLKKLNRKGAKAARITQNYKSRTTRLIPSLIRGTLKLINIPNLHFDNFK